MTETLEESQAAEPTTLPELLYAGEEGLAATEVAGVKVAVTSHRLLVLAPDGGTADGSRFHAVHRPNVIGVRASAAGGGPYLTGALRFGLYAIVLLAAGILIDFDGMLDTVESPDASALSGVISVIRTITRLLTLVDDVLLALGVLAGIAALGLGALALNDRSRYLEVEVAGGEPIRVPVGRYHDIEGAVTRIESALETG